MMKTVIALLRHQDRVHRLVLMLAALVLVQAFWSAIERFDVPDTTPAQAQVTTSTAAEIEENCDGSCHCTCHGSHLSIVTAGEWAASHQERCDLPNRACEKTIRYPEEIHRPPIA